MTFIDRRAETFIKYRQMGWEKPQGPSAPVGMTNLFGHQHLNRTGLLIATA